MQISRASSLCSAAWVLWLAGRLWTAPAPSAADTCVKGRCVYWTTVMNPKALIIGLALIPPAGMAGTLPYLAVLCATVVTVAVLWLALGAAVIRTLARHHPALVGRVAAACLVFFAASLAGRAVGWV